MKRFLSILGVIGITTLSSTPVVACGVDPLEKINETKEAITVPKDDARLVVVRKNLFLLNKETNLNDFKICTIELYDQDPLKHYADPDNLQFIEVIRDCPVIIIKKPGTYNLAVLGKRISSNKELISNGGEWIEVIGTLKVIVS